MAPAPKEPPSLARPGRAWQAILHDPSSNGATLLAVKIIPQSFACLHSHFVFSTKNRLPLIDADLAVRLYAYIGGILKNRKCQLIKAGGIADHIHLLINQARDASVADLVRDIKSNSSKWIHEEFPLLQHFSWQQGYAAFSVSKSGLGPVGTYIDNQIEHHRTRTYQEELRIILDQHEVEYDERYMWD